MSGVEQQMILMLQAKVARLEALLRERDLEVTGLRRLVDEYRREARARQAKADEA